MMVRYTLLFILSILLFSCSKDTLEPRSTIYLNYKIGDHFVYELYREIHIDDTTQTNRDTSIYTTDTLELIIEKDTVINSIQCLVFLSKSKGYSDQKSYIEITDSSYNYYAYLFVQHNEILFYEIPSVFQKKKLTIGTKWENETSIPNNLIVTDLSTLNINNKNFFCAKLQFENQDSLISNFEQYLDEKGDVLIKYDINKRPVIFSDLSGGYLEGKFKRTRIN